METLEINMYVRSKINGLISKITDIEQFEELGQIVERYILDNNYNVGFCSTEKDSVIASHNIIDLIEVSDYVNGKRVKKVGLTSNTQKPYVELDFDNQGYRSCYYENEIKTIVTKQQFESLQYEVK